MNGFVDFSEVKARCSIEQAAKLLGLQTTEERNQLRAPCPACHVVIRNRCQHGRSAGHRLRAQGHDERYVAVPVRLPTGELTGYIGITEGKVPKEFHLSRVVTFSKKSA